jgi:hypothetical protein
VFFLQNFKLRRILEQKGIVLNQNTINLLIVKTKNKFHDGFQVFGAFCLSSKPHEQEKQCQRQIGRADQIGG